MTMRNPKGYLLNEMLLILAMIGIILLLSVEPMRIFFRGVLDTQKAFERQGRLEMLLERLRTDTERASSAFVQSGDERLVGNLLYLAGPDGVVCWQFSEGAAECIGGTEIQKWDLPRVQFEWRLLTLPGDGQAVAMTTQQRHKRRGDGTPVFRSSCVYVVNLNSLSATTERH